MNYNEGALADSVFCRIPKVILLTAPTVIQEMSTAPAKALKEKEVIELMVCITF